MQKKMAKKPIAEAVGALQTNPHSGPLALRRHMPLGAVLLAATAFSHPVFAQETATQEQVMPTVQVRATKDTESKESVRTTSTNIGKGTQDIRDIPQSITVMTEKLIDDAHLPTLREALHYTAGITFAATENGTDQDIRMRGFPVATTGDLLIDGMRDPSQYDRDTFNMDRIEVMRGAASMLFGRGSTGGIINQVTKKPFLADQHEVSTTIGTEKNLRLTGDFNFVTGDDSAMRINVMRQSSDNKGAEIDKYGVAPSFSWGIGTANEFTVGLFHLDVDNIPMAGVRYLNGTVPDLEAGQFYGHRSDYVLGKATYVNASHLHRFVDGAELRTQLRSGVFDRSQWGTTASFPGGASINNINDGTTLTLAGLAPRKDQFKGTYVQSDYSDTFNWFGMEHKIITGVDVAHESADRFGSDGIVGTNYAKGTTTIGAGGGTAALGATPGYRPTETYSAKALGLYIQDTMQIAPKWKVVGGLRFDYFGGDFEQITYPGGVATRASTSMSDNPLSYRAGLLYQPTDFQSYHISYSTSFNTSADTYRFTNAMNANTPPEESRNIEVGAKLDWLDGRLSTRGAIFRTEKTNERTTDADFASGTYLLSGKRHSQGVELDVVGRITPKWEVYMSYSYIHEAKIDRAGSAAANVVGQSVGLTPKHTGAMWTSYQFTPKLRLAGGLTGRSVNRPLQGTTGAASLTNRAPGYVVADAMAEYVLNDIWTAQLNINNIADRNYGDQLYPGFWVSGPGRQALLTLTARF